MKKIIAAIALAIPTIAAAQTQADYEHAVGKFIRHYNKYESDSIVNMWTDYKDDMKRMWSKEELERLHKKYGEILSYKFMGRDTSDHGIRVFKIKGSKKTFALSLTMGKHNELGTFRFDTLTNEIERMLKSTD